MPAKPGEGVGEMLAARSAEKARANLNQDTTEAKGAALAQFLKEKARKKKRPWK
jgi:hypothetical protein